MEPNRSEGSLGVWVQATCPPWKRPHELFIAPEQRKGITKPFPNYSGRNIIQVSGLWQNRVVVPDAGFRH